MPSAPDELRDQVNPTFPPRRAPMRRSTVFSVVALVFEAIAFLWLLCLIIEKDLWQAVWILQLILSVAALLASFWTAVRRKQLLEQPLRRLEDLVPQVREGEAPIEELSQIGGRMGSIARMFQDIFRDLRQQRAELAPVHEEIRQRVE